MARASRLEWVAALLARSLIREVSRRRHACDERRIFQHQRGTRLGVPGPVREALRRSQERACSLSRCRRLAAGTANSRRVGFVVPPTGERTAGRTLGTLQPRSVSKEFVLALVELVVPAGCIVETMDWRR